MYSICFFTVMPSPYQRELFQALSASEKFDVHVFYYIERPGDRSWKDIQYKDYETLLDGKTLTWIWDSAHWNPSVKSRLRESGCDLFIISDYSSITAQYAMWYLTLTGKQWVYWGENPGMRQGIVRNLVRTILMLPIKHGASAVCAIGSRAQEHYQEWLQGKKPVFNIPYFCDLKPYLSASRKPHDRINILYCGQFIPRKGVDTLLDAFARVAEQFPEVGLTLCGGSASDLPGTQIPGRYRDRIHITGFLQPEELPALYASADLFVLPSRYDGWGVVVNEALGAGLPVLASDQVGAAVDLVEHGKNGFIFPAGDSMALAGYLQKLLESESLRTDFARKSREFAHRFTLDEGLHRWENACEQVLSPGS